MPKIKPGSYSQIYIQLVISVRYKHCVLSREIRTEVFKVMGGILNEHGHKPILINGVDDHVHIFFGLNPDIALTGTVKELKRRTSLFINGKGYFQMKFRWQHGYGAFSYSQSHIQRVYKYIENQEEHHAKKTFREEYISFLRRYEIEYDGRYLFNWQLE
ncbi:MAG: IS200/IS605 family transposase [Bacteroidota bacterium]